MQYIGQLKNLKRLYMFDAFLLTDEGVAHLADLKRLTEIHISTSLIIDKSLTVLSGLPELEKLALQFNRFSDQGVIQLASLKRLKSLWVYAKKDERNDISDRSESFLLDLPQFLSLGVQRTSVTAEFKDRMQARFPKCAVYR